MNDQSTPGGVKIDVNFLRVQLLRSLVIQTALPLFNEITLIATDSIHHVVEKITLRLPMNFQDDYVITVIVHHTKNSVFPNPWFVTWPPYHHLNGFRLQGP